LNKSADSKSCTNGKFNGGESPKLSRKRFGSASEEQLPKVNGLNDSMSAIPSADLEALKQDILKEMRKEMGKMKQDIIDGE
jgi:enabled protein